ncbi:hypothetical protein EON63_05165 [archaeon]|nr:MAG: hypothetical protein EON63_05165 [archaeon]
MLGHPDKMLHPFKHELRLEVCDSIEAPVHQVHHTPYTIHHTPYTIHNTPYTIYHTQYIIHHTTAGADESRLGLYQRQQ